MARIVMNGSLKIYPERPPAIVKAHRDLAKIHRQLQGFKSQLDNSDIEAQIGPLVKNAVEIRYAYSDILRDCANALKDGMFSIPQGSRDYYKSVLIFVSRSSEPHSVAPFVDYLGHIRDVLEYRKLSGEIRHIAPFASLQEYKTFVSERVGDSIETCRSYLALLSNSLDSFVQGADINGMLGKIFSIQRTVAVIKSATTDRGTGTDNIEYLCGQAGKSSFAPGDLPKTENVGPILYWFFQQVISNAFKASLVLDSFSRARDLEFKHLGEEYASVSSLSDPMVKVTTNALSSGKALVSIEDNGIGIPRSLLPAIFSSEIHHGVFYRCIPSNGSSTCIMPFVADLTGTEIEVRSEVGRGTKFLIAVPSLN